MECIAFSCAVMGLFDAAQGAWTMWAVQRHTIEMNPDRVVAAVFFNDVSARDALADLKLAQFPPDVIAVAETEDHGTQQNTPPLSVKGKHSIFWRLRHGGERFGSEGNETPEQVAERDPAFTHVNLFDTLTGLGVAETTIRLIADRMGADGFLVLVDAGERRAEAESILVRNRGMLRSAMATEPSSDVLPPGGKSTQYDQAPTREKL